MTLTETVKQRALTLGFDLAGVTGAQRIDPQHEKYLRNWLDKGFAGQMEYMHKNFEKRVDPGALLEGARSVICVGLNYKPPAKHPPKTAQAKIANFGLYEDYHGFIKQRLYQLCKYIRQQTPKQSKFKVCVDSVPILERAFAQRAGIGFIGKNHMLIHPKLGPEILLGLIVTDVELETATPMKDHCADCDKCVRACPTGALGADGSFDANKCISYQTIENKNDIPETIAEKMGSKVFGCDECMLACPYETNSQERANAEFKFFPERQDISLKEIHRWDQDQFERYFTGSPIERTGLEKFRTNARQCIESDKV